MAAAELALEAFQIKRAAMTAPAVVAPERRCLAALKATGERQLANRNSSPTRLL